MSAMLPSVSMENVRTSANVEVHKGQLLMLGRISPCVRMESSHRISTLFFRSFTDQGTHTFTEDTDTLAAGSAVNANDDMVIRATSAIRHEDNSVERLFIRENILCMMVVSESKF
jgi:hypothetical protein